MRPGWISKTAIVATALAVCLAGCNKPGTETKPWHVTVAYLGPHELINQIVAGIRSDMGPQFQGRPVEISERHANNDATQISSMLSGVLSEHPDLLLTITTPVSQQAVKNAPASLPVVFVGVTDPIGAGLAKTLEKPELSTGVSDVPPLERTLQIIRALSPNAHRLGFPYSPNEQPAVYSRKQVEALGPKYGFTVDARSVTSQDELGTLLRDLLRKDDALMVGADNGMFNSAPLLAKAALDAHKPFYAADSSSVKAGAVAGVTVDYTQVGKAGGEVAKRVLGGEKSGTIAVVSMSDGVLEVNSSTLKKLGITLPPTVASQIQHTYP